MHTKANSTPAPRHLTKKLRPLLALAGSLAAASVLHAQTTWTGAVDSEFLTAGNWSNGAPNNSTNLGTISSGTVTWTTGNANGRHITQNGGAVSVNTTTSLTLQNGGAGQSTYNLNGGTFDISNTGRLNLGDGGTLNVNGGGLTSTGGGVLWLNHANALVNINQNLTTSVQIFNRLGVFTVDGAAFQIGDFTLGSNASSAFLALKGGASMNVTTSFQSVGATKSVSFADGANAFSAAAWGGSGLGTTTFDFASSGSGSSITITSGAWDAAAWEAKWTGGLLTVDGGNAGNFADFFTVSGNTLTYAAVPEPGSFALIGAMGALAFAGMRRHRRAL